MEPRDRPQNTPETPLRVPIAAAAERGVSWLTDLAAERRVVLTRYGRPAAAVDSAERLDGTARLVGEARREVTDRVADLAAGRVGAWHDLDLVCERLGIDPDRVRARARELADAPPSDG
jgi:PHD/YefM family antitoxin component YafN of YafNO toxin-antitoxin module